MSLEPQLALGTDAERNEAVLRISEALSACGEPEELARVLADQLRELISVDHLDVQIFKEDSNEIEWHGWGTKPFAFPDLPVEETSSWHVYNTQEPSHVADWDADGRFPRLKRLLEMDGVKLGSVIRVPLTTRHRRLGTLGIASRDRNAYRSEDVRFLQLLSRGFALAIDDVLNLRRSQAARLELERQNARLKLLLDLTNRVTSNLDLREVLRSTAASIRELMDCDYVRVSLRDAESGRFKIFAMDFPKRGGPFDEQWIWTPEGPSKKALDALKPILLTEIKPTDHD